MRMMTSMRGLYSVQEAMESSAFPNKIKMTLIKLKMYKLMNIFGPLKLCKSAASWMFFHWSFLLLFPYPFAMYTTGLFREFATFYSKALTIKLQTLWIALYLPESRTELEMGPGWPASTALRTVGTLVRPRCCCGGNGWLVERRLGGFATHLRLAEAPNCWSSRLAGKSGPQSKSQAGMAAGCGSMLYTNN